MKQIILGCIILASVMAGCYKDKGNYDLHDINKITIGSSAPDTIRLFQGEMVEVAGIIEQSIPVAESKLSYKWTMYEYLGSSFHAILGDQKNLKATINAKPGKYNILFTVTDPETGVSSFRNFYTEVNSILSEGWLVLEDRTDGSQDVAIIPTVGDPVHDLFSMANEGEKLPPNAHSIRVLNTYRNEQNVFVLCENDGVDVDYAGFKKFGNAASWLMAAPPVMKPQGYFYTKLGVTAFFVNNGEVHTFGFAFTGPVKLGAPIKGDWTISKYGMPYMSSDECILYDTKNQRYLSHKNQVITTFNSPAGAPFNMNNVGKQLLYAGASTDDFFNCVMKNNNENRFFIYRVQPAGANPANAVWEILDAPGIENATLFQSSGLYNQMYYVSGNNVYLLDIPAQKARLVYAFPAGINITAMELKQAPGLLISYPDNNKTLAVGTNESGEGKLYIFSINNTGDFVNGTYSKMYTGFGNIRDLEFKNRK